MITSIILNWLLGFLIGRNPGKVGLRRFLLAADVILNLGLLFVFKYLNFTGDLLNRTFAADLRLPKIALPIGISFFTFQTLSYVVDVYREERKPLNNLFYVGLYISFFPQLIAGPIVRYDTIADEIRGRKETGKDCLDGFARFVVGLAKKVSPGEQLYPDSKQRLSSRCRLPNCMYVTSEIIPHLIAWIWEPISGRYLRTSYLFCTTVPIKRIWI